MPSDDVKWGYIKLMTLISLLRRQPVLWNQKLPEYSSYYERKLALDFIAKNMNTTSDKIRRKLHTMRSQYLKEYRIMRTNHNYKPKWKLFDEFRFVFQHNRKDHNMMRKSTAVIKNCDDDDTQNSLNENYIHSNNETISPEVQTKEHFPHNEHDSTFEKSTQNFEINLEENIDNDIATSNSQNEQYNIRASISNCTKVPKSSYPIQMLQIHSNVDNTISKATHYRDEFTIFGEAVANELRLLKEHQSFQLTLKCKIMRALLEANEALHRLGWTK